MNQFKKMSFDEQAEAMQIICNIQTMQQKIYGEQIPYENFVGYSADSLRELQNYMIEEWNKTLKH